MSDRPMRDVSARSAIGTCDHCGGHAHSTLGGEHIWKCSEVVPAAAIEELAVVMGLGLIAAGVFGPDV